MTKRDLLRRVSPIVLSAAVALTSMPSAVLAADFTDSEIAVEEAAAAETEASTENAEAEFTSDETAEVEASVEAEVSEEAAEVTAETEEAAVEEEAPAAEAVTEETTEEAADLFTDASVEEAFTDSVGDTETGTYVYGTVNLSYADYFYGELNDVEEDADMDLDAEDAAAELREDGMYDTITCATNSKSMRYGTAWGQSNEDGTAELYGIKDVNIAVPTTLYEEATAAITAGSTCSNKLLEIVGNMTVSATETAPAEYKVLNGDGTLTAMKTETKTDELWTATISTDTVWGDYLVVGDLGDSQSSVTTSNLLGIVVETSDGAKYGMLHSQNTWLQTYEFAFAVTEGFVEPHGNTIDYQRFADMQGKTITKITYLLEDSADLVINNISLLCKYQLTDTQTITGTASGAYTEDGATVQMTRTELPESSAYALASVEFNGNVLTEGTDYTYDAGTDILTIKNKTSTSAGTYSLTYTDATYENIYTDVEVSSGLEEGDVKIENNVLIVDSDLYTVADYLTAVTATTLDGSALSAGRHSAANAAALAVFDNSTGKVDFEAQLNKANVFTKGDGGVYEIELTSTAFPGVSGTLTDDAGEYKYVYAGLTWAEYWASEDVYNEGNTTSSEELDRRNEKDLGGYDAVTRATTRHGLHRGSFQSSVVITGESEKTYTLVYWDGTTAVFADGSTASVSKGVLTFSDGTTDTMTSYQNTGIKYVPVKVAVADYETFCTKYSVVEYGGDLKGGYSEKSLASYSYTAEVNENTNGLKTATLGSDGNFTFSGRTTGTTSGLKGTALKTAGNITITVKEPAGDYGEFLRVDLTGDYGGLGGAMQAVKWTYYGDGETALQTYGTKFAADNWMHSSNGIQLGLTESLRCQLPEGTDGTGKWNITIYALGYNDYSFDIEVTDEDIAKAAGNADKTSLESAIAQAKALVESDYTPESWAAAKESIEEKLKKCETMLETIDKQTQYGVTEQISQLTEAMAKLVKAEFKLNKSSLTLYTQNTTSATLKVTTNLTGTPTWKSSNTKVAAVDANGKVTAKGVGTAKITASLGAKTATCTVTVKLNLNKTSATIYYKGKPSTVTLKAISGVTWKSSNKKVATVDKNGKVTAKKKGTVTITATLGKNTATCKVTVKNPSISAKAAASTIYKGKTTTIKVTKYGVTGTAKFTSSNKKIATVNSKGKVTGKKAGTVKITVKVGSYKKTVTIKVKNPTLKLKKSSATLKKGKTTTIKATATPSGKITYKSSNTKVATVDKNGKVTAKKKGTAKITVKCNGVAKTFKVTVK